MFSKSRFFNRPSIRVISFLLIQTFLFYNVGFTQAPKAVSIQKENLAPYIVSRLILDDSAIKRLDRALAQSRKLGDTEKLSLEVRVARVKQGWVRRYLKLYVQKVQADIRKFGIILDAEFLQRIFFQGLEIKIDELKGDLDTDRKELLKDIEGVVEKEIAKLMPETPGTQATGDVLDASKAAAFDEILKASFERDKAKAIDRLGEGDKGIYEFTDKDEKVHKLGEGLVFVKHDGLIHAIDKANETRPTASKIPYNIHPGRGGEANAHGLLEIHIDSFVFEKLEPKELFTIGRHEQAHLYIFNVERMSDEERNKVRDTEAYRIWEAWAEAGKPVGQAQEDFVNSLPMCDTSAVAERIKVIIETPRKAEALCDDALNDVITNIIERSEGERKDNGGSHLWECIKHGETMWIDVLDDLEFDRAIVEHNWNSDNPTRVSMGLPIHRGTKKTSAFFKEDGNLDRVEKHCYIRRSIYEALSDQEKKALLKNTEMHVLIKLGGAEVPADKTKDEYVNLQYGCDISQFMEKMETTKKIHLLKNAKTIIGEGVKEGNAEKIALGIAFGIETMIESDDSHMLTEIFSHLFHENMEQAVEKGKVEVLFREAFRILNGKYPLAVKDWLPRALDSDALSKAVKDFFRGNIGKWLAPKEIDPKEIQAVIMAGGGGTRVFPLSTNETPKQLLGLVGNQPLVVVTIERLRLSGMPIENIYIQTVPELKDKIYGLVKDLGIKEEQIFAEPKMADTAAAIGYASAKLMSRGKGDKPTFICTADHVIGRVRDIFKDCYRKAAAMVKESPLVGTIGIRPEGPSQDYGHIKVGRESLVKDAFVVGRFKEKPKSPLDEEMFGETQAAIKEGRYPTDANLFNSGMFLATPKTFFLAFRGLAPEYYSELTRIVKARKSAADKVEGEVFKRLSSWKANGTFPHHDRLPGGTSVDFALAEPLGANLTANVGLFVVPGEFPWTDIGGYRAVYEYYQEHFEEPFDSEGNLVLKPHGVEVEVNGQTQAHEGLIEAGCKGNLVIIGEMPESEKDIKIKLNIRGATNSMIIYNPKTRTTLVAPMSISGNDIKAIGKMVGKKGEKWAQYVKGGPLTDSRRESIFRSDQDHVNLFSCLEGRALQYNTQKLSNSYSDVYSDFGLVIIAGMEETRVVQHMEKGSKDDPDEIHISIGSESKKEDFAGLIEGLRSAQVKRIKKIGRKFSKKRVEDFIEHGRDEDVTIGRYARMYALDVDTDLETINEEIVHIVIAKTLHEKDPKKREDFVLLLNSEDLLTKHLVDRIIAVFDETETTPRLRTAMIECCDLLVEHGNSDVRKYAGLVKKRLLNGKLGQTKSPEDVKAEVQKMLDTIKKLKFGTSGTRGKVTVMTDMECYIYTTGYLAYLIKAGDIKKGEMIAIAGDLRDSTDRILEAVARAITDSGFGLEYCGKIPTPALLNWAIGENASIMVTGSHNPADENALKFNRKAGEVLKSDEAGIVENVERARREEYTKVCYEESLFDKDGKFKEKSTALKGADNSEAEAIDEFVGRYTNIFPEGCFEGKNVFVYEHSAVGRDILKRVLTELGAKVIVPKKNSVEIKYEDSTGKTVKETIDFRSDVFIPVDTENVTEKTRAILKKIVELYKPDVIMSTDGDSDRPLWADENGEFLPGDKLGMLASLSLEPTFAAIPVSANNAVIDALREKGIKVRQTRIGSPYVIKAMVDELIDNPQAKVVSWEVNGGFLTGSDWIINAETLKAVPSRDSFPPLLNTLLLMIQEGVTASELAKKHLPAWATYAAKTALPMEVGQAITASFLPEDENIEEVQFEEKAQVAYEDGTIKELDYNDETAISLVKLRDRLQGHFTGKLGFSAVIGINFVDGIKVYFENGEISQLRPSGNEDYFRNYGQAKNLERAQEIVKIGLNEIVPKMRKELAPKATARKTRVTRLVARSSEDLPDTPGVYGALGFMGDEEQETKELLARADFFASNLRRMLELHPDEMFLLAFDSDIGKRQEAQIMPLRKAVRKLQEMTGDDGKPMFPNLIVEEGSGSAGALMQKIQGQLAEGLRKDHTFLVTRQGNVEGNVFANLKDAAWIGAIDDAEGNQFDYLPVFEMATIMFMSALEIEIGKIRDFYNSISETQKTEEEIEEMILNRNFYVLPKMMKVDPNELREFYEKVRKIYLAA